MSDRKTGTVVFFSNIKNYGFIKPDVGDVDRDLFCHFSAIQMEGYKTLAQGDRVEYALGENHKGPVAVDVVIVERAVK